MFKKFLLCIKYRHKVHVLYNFSQLKNLKIKSCLAPIKTSLLIYDTDHNKVPLDGALYKENGSHFLQKQLSYCDQIQIKWTFVKGLLKRARKPQSLSDGDAYSLTSKLSYDTQYTRYKFYTLSVINVYNRYKTR